MSQLLEFVAEEIVGKGAAEITPLLGGAILIVKGLQKALNDHEISIRDSARKLIGCVHLEICDGSGPPTADKVLTAFTKKGCAFSNRGVALWHFQNDLDVRVLSPRVIRYDRSSRKVGYYQMATSPCRVCSS
jgi:hypothetical protein